MTAARVLIADDHAPTRELVREALTRAGFEVCAEASDAAGAVRLAGRHRPDVCLLDIYMPGGGIAAAAAINDQLTGTAIVMLTVSAEDSDLFDALRAGARGYLLKGFEPEKLADELRRVLTGEAALPISLVTKLVEEFRQRHRRGRALGGRRIELTEREWEILEMMRSGATTNDMADRLFVAPVTVRTHVSAILRKLQVGSRVEAVRIFEAE